MIQNHWFAFDFCCFYAVKSNFVFQFDVFIIPTDGMGSFGNRDLETVNFESLHSIGRSNTNTQTRFINDIWKQVFKIWNRHLFCYFYSVKPSFYLFTFFWHLYPMRQESQYWSMVWYKTSILQTRVCKHFYSRACRRKHRHL